jgi:asparagine synthase (glutamine-hydrolysing)
MCAINGFTFQNKDLIQEMNLVTKHRGPDATGFFLSEGISFGHNRLSIIDVREVSNQPMKSDDERYVIIYNGEIYNFKEIKEDLSEFKFNTESDTEVILKGYQKFGLDIFSKMNGMYSIAIWDNHKKELILARDPQGIKPLYYTLDKNNNLIFSSEIKAILKHDIEKTLDRDAFYIYMSIYYVPAPLTMFKDIFKLEPGNVLIFSDGVMKKKEIIYQKSSKTISKLEDLIDDSVKRQLISDRPVGIFLSGGIDSSIILDSTSRIHKKINTFSASFDLGDKEKGKKFNEDSVLAKKVAELYGSEHNEIKITLDDVANNLQKVIREMDEPVANPTIVPMYLLSKFAKEKVDVVLGGDGGDELFGGYERYRLSYISDWYQKITPNFIRKFLSKYFSVFKKLNKQGIEKYKLFHFQKDKVINQVIKDKSFINSDRSVFFKNYFLQYKNFTENFLLADQYVWLIDESLIRSDKICMLNSLENRVPLLDLELSEFAHSVPVYKKVDFFNKKKILKKAFSKRIPKFILKQPKRGWFSPGAKWIRDEKILKMFREVLSKDYNKEASDIFNWPEIEKVLEKHVSGEVYNREVLWTIFVFQLWYKEYFNH